MVFWVQFTALQQSVDTRNCRANTLRRESPQNLTCPWDRKQNVRSASLSREDDNQHYQTSLFPPTFMNKRLSLSDRSLFDLTWRAFTCTPWINGVPDLQNVYTVTRTVFQSLRLKLPRGPFSAAALSDFPSPEHFRGTDCAFFPCISDFTIILFQPKLLIYFLWTVHRKSQRPIEWLRLMNYKSQGM